MTSEERKMFMQTIKDAIQMQMATNRGYWDHLSLKAFDETCRLADEMEQEIEHRKHVEHGGEG